MPMGSKEAKAGKSTRQDVIFSIYSSGVKTNRDAWAYNFDRNALTENMNRMIEYLQTGCKWERRGANYEP